MERTTQGIRIPVDDVILNGDLTAAPHDPQVVRPPIPRVSHGVLGLHEAPDDARPLRRSAMKRKEERRIPSPNPEEEPIQPGGIEEEEEENAPDHETEEEPVAIP